MFAKIFTQIFDSSIREDPEARFTFMDLLILCDPNGVVDMTHESIAARTNRPLALIRSTIAVLESPDPRSRTPDNGGRRIVRLDEHRDWGWLIVNYQRFRETASDEQRREKTLARVRKYRAKHNELPLVTPCNAGATLGNASNAMQKQKQKEKQKETPPIPPLAGEVEIPVELQTPEFRDAWMDWNQHRKEIRKKQTPLSVKGQIANCLELGSSRAVAAIRHSIANGWQGIFEPKHQNHAAAGSQSRSTNGKPPPPDSPWGPLESKSL